MLGDTIVAVASPPGAAARGVLRVSGPQAFAAVERWLGAPLPRVRAARDVLARIGGATLPLWVLTMPGPASYSGEDVVELHLPGSPLLLAMVEEALAPLARRATPGEFTRRAFEHGKLDLLGAEAVLELIHAASDDERRDAVAALSGAVPELVAQLRAAVQDALAQIEGGLDFEPAETGAVAPQQWLPDVARAQALVAELRRGAPASLGAGGILLWGAASAGKSSLCNALAGRDAVLVDAAPGTTRDVLAVDAGHGIRLWDSPGSWAGDPLGGELRDRLATRALALLLVVDPARPEFPQPPQPPLAVVWTHADLQQHGPSACPSVPQFRVSNVTGSGVAELRAFLAQHARSGPTPRGRQEALLGECAARLQAARELGERDGGDELAAFELQAALRSLDAIDGRSTPEELLDRIFAAFCLGK